MMSILHNTRGFLVTRDDGLKFYIMKDEVNCFGELDTFEKEDYPDANASVELKSMQKGPNEYDLLYVKETFEELIRRFEV